MNATLTDIVNAVILLLFTLFVAISVVRIVARLWRYHRAGERVPTLLPRDLALMGGLLLPFAMILVFRFLGLSQLVVGQLWWSLVTGIPAVIGVGIMAYYEVAVIERDRRPEP